MCSAINTSNSDRILTDALMRSQGSGQTGDVKGGKSVGSGVNGGGNVPDAPGQAGQSGAPGANARLSLQVFMSTGGQSVDTSVLLVQVAVSMRDTEATTQKSKINTDMEAKKAQAKEKEAKLEEAQKKLAEAQEKKNSANLFDKIKLAFEWLGAVLSAAVGGIMIALGVTAAIGVALVAAAVVAITMAIDSTIQMATGMGIAGNFQMMADKAANARGENVPPLTEAEMKERAGKADMGFRISMAVIGIALALATGGKDMINGIKNIANAIKEAGSTAIQFGRAAVSSASTAGNAASTVAKTADGAQSIAGIAGTASKLAKSADSAADFVNVAEDSAQAAQKIGGFWGKLSDKAINSLATRMGTSAEQATKTLQTAKSGIGAAEDVGQMTSTAIDMGSLAERYKATETSADAKRLQASAKQDEAMMEMLDDMIDQALSRLMASGDRFNAVLDSIVEAVQDRSNTLSRAQFRG